MPKQGIKEGDFVFMTDAAAKRLHETAVQMIPGGTVKNILNGVAEVHVVVVHRVNVDYLTTGDNAFDPIP